MTKIVRENQKALSPVKRALPQQRLPLLRNFHLVDEHYGDSREGILKCGRPKQAMKPGTHITHPLEERSHVRNDDRFLIRVKEDGAGLFL